MQIENNSTLLFTGDSITDADRQRPVGEGVSGQLGAGFVNLVGAYLTAFHPQKRIRVLNTGVGGDTTRELSARWDADVLALKPDYVCCMIGVNDCWRHFGRFWNDELLVSVEEYKNTLCRLIDRTLPQVKGMVLMTPYYFEASPQEPMRASMDAYRAAMKDVAHRKNLPCFDTQEPIDRALKNAHPCMLSADHVHPNTGGQMILMRTFLEGMNLW